MDRAATVDIPLTITCMIEAHGSLHAYLTADGKIAVRACEFCLNIAHNEGRAAADVDWKREIADALDAGTRV